MVRHRTIILAALLSLAFPHLARAAADLRLDGTVPAVCVLRIADMAPVIDVRNGVRDLPIARVDERCNAVNGYRIVLMSSNGGVLAGDRQAVDYTVSYGPLRGTRLDSPRAIDNTAPQTDWRSRTLAVSIPPLGIEVAGRLSDAVILSIEAR